MGNKGNEKIGSPKPVEIELSKLTKPNKKINPIDLKECKITEEQKEILNKIPGFIEEIYQEEENDEEDIFTPETQLSSVEGIETQIKTTKESIKPFQDFGSTTISYQLSEGLGSSNTSNSDFFLSNLLNDYDPNLNDEEDHLIKDIKNSLELNSFHIKEIDEETQNLEREYWNKKEKINDDEMLDLMEDKPVEKEKLIVNHSSPDLFSQDEDSDETIIGSPDDDLSDSLGSHSPPIEFNSKISFDKKNKKTIDKFRVEYFSQESSQGATNDYELNQKEDSIVIYSSSEDKDDNEIVKLVIEGEDDIDDDDFVEPDFDEVEEIIPGTPPKKRKIEKEPTLRLEILSNSLSNSNFDKEFESKKRSLKTWKNFMKKK